MPLLDIENLSIAFRQHDHVHEVVHGVSLAIEKGEMLALVGESGSGKSLTALSCLQLLPAGAVHPTGSIRFQGEDILGMAPARLRALRGNRISMIFQEPMTALNPLHTIGRQIGEMFHHDYRRNMPTAPRVEMLLEQVGLGYLKDRLEAYPHQLSGGERQRVMIAMAIANNPDMLIADEPTTAVDVTIQAKILELLKTLQQSMGMAILFITHDLTIVRHMADRVAIMQQGRVVEAGKVRDVFSSPQHPYTQHLLASEPKGSPVPVDKISTALISCENLKVWFPIKKGLLSRVAGHVKAVDDISISIPEQSTLGIVGESGSGKTTLGLALLRLVKSEGTIVFMGQSVEKLRREQLRPLRKHMQLVFQDPYGSLNPRMSVLQIVGEGLGVHEPHLSEAQREQRVEEILQEVGLTPEMKQRYPHEFSGGQRQRISIARAMILRPRLVVLDEPTSALDLSMQAQIIVLLRTLQHRYGLSYAFISHDLRVIRAISHQVVVMRAGVVVEAADTHTLFTAPRHGYTKSLLKAAFLQQEDY